MPRASRAALDAAEKGPNYSDALEIITGRIANSKKAQSEASGKASQAWASIEKMGIHKRGAQMAASIISMEDEDDRIDLLRSFSGILAAAGVGIPTDLVDQAMGKEPPPVVPVQPAAAKPEIPKGPDDSSDLAGGETVNAQGAAEGEPPVDRKPRGKKAIPSVAEAKAAVAKHFGGNVTPLRKPGGDAQVPDAL